MVRSFSKDSRPERAAQGQANEYYDPREANRYTGTSNSIQQDLTYKALELLDVKKGEFYFIADIGCGSGLSSRILSLEGHPWVGTDISLDMLSLAQNQDDNQNGKAAAGTRGYLTASDMSQGLPFRTNSLDFAISISAVQWLCYNKHPKEAAERFFKAVWRCLRDSSASRAAFQVYLESDDQMNILLEAARSAGFLAVYFMDYPHKTLAKKFYIILSKEKVEEIEKDENSIEKMLSVSCCNLAWPATACCSLPWLTRREGNNPCAARLCATKVVQEHANTGKRTLRLLRHASSLDSTLPSPTLLLNSADNSGSSAQEERVLLEIAVPHQGFMPCGGPLMLQIQINSETLSKLNSKVEISPPLESRKRKKREEEVGVIDVVVDDEIDEVDNNKEEEKGTKNENKKCPLPPGAGELLKQFLGCSDEEIREAYNSKPKAQPQKNKKQHNEEESKVEASTQGSSFSSSSWPDHIQKARTAAAAAAAADEKKTNDASKKKVFFYLEHIPGEVDSQSEESSSVAILHASKPPLPQVLVLTSNSTSRKSVENVRKKLVLLCKERNASVIGIDMIVHSLDNVSCAWLVYVPGLQTTPRKEIFEQWSIWQSKMIDVCLFDIE